MTLNMVFAKLNGNVRMAYKKKSHLGCGPHCHGLRTQTALQLLIITLLKGLASHFLSRVVFGLQILNGPGFTMSKGQTQWKAFASRRLRLVVRTVAVLQTPGRSLPPSPVSSGSFSLPGLAYPLNQYHLSVSHLRTLQCTDGSVGDKEIPSRSCYLWTQAIPICGVGGPFVCELLSLVNE